MARPQQSPQEALRAFYQTSEVYEAALCRAANESFADYVEMLSRVSKAGDLVLDGGCGVGQSLALLSQTGRQAIGVDLSQRFLRLARRRCASVVAADLTRLPFPDGSFDAVGFYQVIEHLPDVAGALRELLRVTRPGGAVVTYVASYFSVTRNRVRAVLARQRGARGPLLVLIAWEALRGVWVTLGKLLSRCPRPHYVRPLVGDDWRDSDYDTVAAVHPLDMVRMVRAQGCKVVLETSPSDSPARRIARRLLWHFGPGWWVIVRKAERQ